MPAAKEETLSEPVSAWLREQGYTPFVEVPVHGASAVDVVGRRPDGHLIAVELKRALNRHAVYQAQNSQSYMHLTYVAVLTRPTSFENLRIAARVGVGVLWWDGERMNLVLSAHDRFSRNSWFKHYHKAVIDRVSHMRSGGVAGRPCLKGVGPAIAMHEDVKKFLKNNPSATAHDLFTKVPNHYKSAKSMASVLRARFGIRVTTKRRRSAC